MVLWRAKRNLMHKRKRGFTMHTISMVKLVLKIISVLCLAGLLCFSIMLTMRQPTYAHWKIELRQEIISLEKRIISYQQNEQILQVEQHQDAGAEYLDRLFSIPKKMDERTRKLSNIHDYIYRTLDQLQNDGDCEKKKIIRCHNSVMSGFGSSIHRHVICLHIAFALGRAFFIEHDYNSFNGLAAFTKLESGKCSYLKNKLSEIKDTCNFKDSKCYLGENKFEINNNYKMLDFTHEANFPAPKYIPGTLPRNMQQELLKLGVGKPWHWFTAQLLGYMILRPNDEFREKLIQTLNIIELKRPVLSMHVRRGDKIGTESHLIDETTFVDTAMKHFNVSHGDLYLASGDKSAIFKIKRLVEGKFRVRQSPANKLTNMLFKRNDKSKETMQNILIDLYILAQADISVVTFSSNIGRLVWELKTAMFPYNAKNNVISLDSKLFYGWYDYSAATTYYLTVGENNRSYTIPNDYSVLEYRKGQLYFYHARRTLKGDDGKSINLTKVSLRENRKIKGYIPTKDLIIWPGRPTYVNDL